MEARADGAVAVLLRLESRTLEGARLGNGMVESMKQLVSMRLTYGGISCWEMGEVVAMVAQVMGYSCRSLICNF